MTVENAPKQAARVVPITLKQAREFIAELHRHNKPPTFKEMNMAATRQDIEGWFDRGVAQKARHMIVVCDSFDYDDYPVFTTTDDECLQRYKNPGEMQRVMEVYDLRADKAEQMNERRAMRLPEAANA